jgi:hypothetical protein
LGHAQGEGAHVAPCTLVAHRPPEALVALAPPLGGRQRRTQVAAPTGVVQPSREQGAAGVAQGRGRQNLGRTGHTARGTHAGHARGGGGAAGRGPGRGVGPAGGGGGGSRARARGEWDWGSWCGWAGCHYHWQGAGGVRPRVPRRAEVARRPREPLVAVAVVVVPLAAVNTHGQVVVKGAPAVALKG